MNKIPITSENKKKILIGTVVASFGVLLIILLLIFFKTDKLIAKPVLTIETPQKISLSEKEEFLIDVTISTLGETVYPAASMSIYFDSSSLEFIGVEEGNVFIRNDENDVPQKLPDWSCNAEQSNKTGKINIMYLDTTGGKNAFSQELLEDEDNVVLRLKFQLRGSARKDDVYDLIFEDAVFAASNENESLAMTTDTLKVRNGKIVVGE